MCVVGLALRVVRVESGRKYHVQFAAGRLAELLHQLGAGGSQVNERQRLPRSKLTDCIGVGTVGRRQAVNLKMTAHQRRDKHRQRTLGLGLTGIGQQIGSILLRRSVAGRILRLFIIVAELDQQQVTRAQCSLDRRPKALLTETFGAAAVAGVIANRNTGGKVEIKSLPHAALRPSRNIVVLYGGITDPENARCHRRYVTSFMQLQKRPAACQAFAWLGWGTGGILVNMAFRASGVATLDTTISKITAVK